MPDKIDNLFYNQQPETKMTRFIRIGKSMIHVPSVANVTMASNCMGKPCLSIFFHQQVQQEITYSWSQWEECQVDLVRIKTALREIELALEKIPLMEENDKGSAGVVLTSSGLPAAEELQDK